MELRQRQADGSSDRDTKQAEAHPLKCEYIGKRQLTGVGGESGKRVDWLSVVRAIVRHAGRYIVEITRDVSGYRSDQRGIPTNFPV
ncbi:hypothetical protein VTO73DRAFT_2009 [Trametes versicolor]